MNTAVSKGFREFDTTKGFEMVDRYNSTLTDNISDNDYFFITVGKKLAMFTLWRYYYPKDIKNMPFYNPYRYIRTLSNNFNVAVEKALNFMGNSGKVLRIYDETTIEYDYSGDIFQFGKYKGEKISEVAEKDINYLIYISKNRFKTNSTRIINNFTNIDNQVEAYFTAKREKNKANSRSEYIGAEGDKILDLRVRITSVKIVKNELLNSPYASACTCKIKAVDDRGNEFRMDFGSKTANYPHCDNGYKVGDGLHIKIARIKKNVEIMGIKTTILNYVKFS